jgi:esterase/lipase
MTRSVEALVDEEGENRAVRCFLLAYGGSVGMSVGGMRATLKRSGWDGYWPEWVVHAHPYQHLTKAGAQLWIRHLFELEKA